MNDRRSGYVPGLTALRGVAALLVVVFHFQKAFGALAPGDAALLFARGYLWVDLFFQLSGFVIAQVYLEHFAAGVRGREYRAFMTARFARIYPLHLFSLLAVVAGVPLVQSELPQLMAFFEGAHSGGAFLSNLFLVHALGLHDTLTWNGPSWSISVEWWVYLAAPFLLWGVGRRGGATMLAFYAALVAGLIALEQLGGGRGLDLTYDYGLPRGALGFGMGVALQRLHSEGWGEDLMGRALFLVAALVGIAAAFAWCPLDAAIAPLFSLLILAAGYDRGPVSRLLESRPLRFLGDISYSVYMLQGALLTFFTIAVARAVAPIPVWELELSQPERWGLMVVFCAIVVGLATLTHRYFERPARTLVRGFFGDGKARG